jgi:parallel beta-helix repeat protein
LSGINLTSSSWNTLFNNTARDNHENGISLTDSHDLNLTNNTAFNNNQNGILLTNITGTSLTGNNASYNGFNGISLVNSDNIRILNNTANNNTQNGISLTNSSDNLLFNNTFRFNHQNGILLTQSSNRNDILENSVCGNLWNGIEVNGSDWNNLVNNTVCNNGRNGILLTAADHNNLEHNNITGNLLDGINLTNSDWNTLFNNTVSNNRGNGISLNSSDNNWLEGNNLASNTKSGVLVQNSFNDTVINNTIQRNGNGVTFENTNVSYILGNLISEQTGNGITLNSSYSNLIANNTVVNNGQYGIYYNGSGNNTVYNNWFNNNANVKLDGSNLGNHWNIPKTGPYPNIYGGPYLGGNYWAQPNGQGWSQITPNRSDGFTTIPFRIDQDNIDELPLTNFTPIPPAPPNPYPDYISPFPPFPDNETWDSDYISDTVPDHLNPCESRNVSITFENNGTVSWTRLKGVVLIPQSNCGFTIVPQHIQLEPGVEIFPGEQYTFNFTIIAPCTNTTCNLTARMSRYATAKSKGIVFGDIYWEIIDVSDQVKQAVKTMPVNIFKGSNSLVLQKDRAVNITIRQATMHQFVPIPTGKESRYLPLDIPDRYVAGKEDVRGLRNMTLPSSRAPGVTESRFQALYQGEGAPVYPVAGDVFMINARKGIETAVTENDPDIFTNSISTPDTSFSSQRNYLKILSPVLFIFINTV